MLRGHSSRNVFAWREYTAICSLLLGQYRTILKYRSIREAFGDLEGFKRELNHQQQQTRAPLRRPLHLLFLSALLRIVIVLLMYVLHQDTIEYTDIDYHVFTDASRFPSNGQSPYSHETLPSHTPPRVAASPHDLWRHILLLAWQGALRGRRRVCGVGHCAGIMQCGR
ncbi:hypothetical protein BGX38DRAFT_1285965 [Terfezia claveryi]|nr:hypothetical protein BGX38DRAFT_1285965 [Terfezia claveryi]